MKAVGSIFAYTILWKIFLYLTIVIGYWIYENLTGKDLSLLELQGMLILAPVMVVLSFTPLLGVFDTGEETAQKIRTLYYIYVAASVFLGAATYVFLEFMTIRKLLKEAE